MWRLRRRAPAPAILLALLITAVHPSAHGTTRVAAPLSVLYYVNGSLGDKGIADSGESGVLRAAALYHIQVKTVQQSDPSRFQSDLSQLAASHRYNIIIAGTSSLHDQVQAVARAFPTVTFLYYDDVQPGKNIVSVKYLQNEGSFLAGALAALVADSHMPLVSGKRAIGMVGGQDIPVINDFRVGYTQGAQYVDPHIKVLTAYMGGTGGDDTWNNPRQGAALAKALYQQGAAVVFAVAGGSGLGVLKQSADSNRYSIGVDADQNGLYPGHVLSSMVKHLDTSFVTLLGLAVHGKLQANHTYVFGLANGGIGLAEDSYYHKLVPLAIQERLDAVLRLVQSGKIHIRSAFS